MNNEDLLKWWNEYKATGDVDALTRIYKTLYNDLKMYADGRMKMKNQIKGGEDVVQDIFLKLVNAENKPDIRGSVKGFFIRAIQNGSIDWYRKEKHKSLYINELKHSKSVEKPISDIEKSEEDKAKDQIIKRCLKEKDYVFFKRLQELYFNNKNTSEAYQMLSTEYTSALQTIYNRKARIVEQLKKCVEREKTN